MFQRLYELSQCLPSAAPWERLNQGMPANYDRGLALCFDTDGRWAGVRTRNGNQGVVYRKGPSNGTDFTPCCKLAVKTADRLPNSVQAVLDSCQLPPDKNQWLAASLAAFRAEQGSCWEQVMASRAAAGIDDKEHFGYVYWADAAMNPIYAWPELHDAMVERALADYAERGGTRNDGYCAVCGQGPVRVFGNYSVLACYNLNNPGSIAGGFRAADAHRNFPVCADCALTLADTLSFVTDRLTSRMAGQTYLILPYTNDPEIRDELRERFARDPARYALGKARDLVAEELQLAEDYGPVDDAGGSDQLAFMLVFFQQSNAAWRVQAEVQELLPSRLRALHQAATAIARAPDLIVETKTETKPVQITANTFRSFAGGTEKSSEETLRAWLAALFSGRSVDRASFVRALTARLLDTGRRNADLFNWTARHAWGLYRYAILTGLILSPRQRPTAEDIATMNATLPDSPYGRYLRDHHDFFRRPELAVAFLTGCYAAVVASVQHKERGASPFTKKFIGRLLGRAQLQRLYREGHAKLAQYDKLGYVISGLDPDLANAWVQCGDRWDIGDDEATFAFTVGYSLNYRIGALDRAARAAAETGPDADRMEPTGLGNPIDPMTPTVAPQTAPQS